MNAVPSFEPKWAAHQADHQDYVARFPDAALSEKEAAHEFLWQLASHIGEEFAAGRHPEELPWLFAALEPIYREADRALWDALTVGFLESVTYAAERRGGSAAGVRAHAAGPETAHAWRAAYEYIHPPHEPIAGRGRRG